MTYCHECGSEVAEIDVFCPFCGITLQPISVADSEDEAFASTIFMPLPERADAAAAANDASTADNDDTNKRSDESALPDTLEKVEIDAEFEASGEKIVEIETAADEVSAVDSYPTEPDVTVDPGGTAAEDIPLPNLDDIPTPKILEDLEKSGEGVFDMSSATKAEEPDPEIAASTGAQTEGQAEPDSFAHAKTEEEVDLAEVELSHEEIDMADLYGGAAPISNAEPETPNMDLEIDIGHVFDEPAAETPSLSSISADEPEPAVEPPPEDPMLHSRPEIYKERVRDADESISKPLDNLESVDRFASQSMFDSVRIMEGQAPERKPEPVLDARPEPMNADDNVSATPSPESERRSHTTPNIGVGDTSGRGGAKLKPLEEGTILNGRYEIVRKIGGGGMGAVYLASDNNLGGVLRAVKEMVQAHIEEEQQEKAINDFKRESMILSTLDHPSIPTIYDYFYDEEETRFYLVMKYVSGGDLSARLRAAPEGRIDEKSVTEWAVQIADVLDYLHNQPTTIVYRDLKPSNIMIDGNSGRVMLIDFGIARSIGQKEEKGVTAVGTMGYAPPELFSGNVEPRSDIYSLGSTMFHLLTGADPQSNPLLIFDFQKNPRPRQINPQLSDQIERFLMRTVEYNAQARFGSAAEVRRSLEEHLENLKKANLTFGVKEIPASVSLANQTVFCGFCGQRIVATDLFCAFCGAKQPIAQQGVHSEIYSHQSSTARLLIMGTSELESPAFSLEKDDNLIGRRDPMSNIFPEVDLSKYDPQTKISRRHARIWREGNSFLVEDLGSSNGTVLLPAVSDMMRLTPHQPHALTSGDQIKLGDTTLHFVIG
jgi:serine/threonine protein kinase